MGGFYVNFHARTEDLESLRAALRRLTERAWVSRPQDGWLSFLEESASSQDARVIERIAASVSRELDCPVISFLIHDDSVLHYFLFNKGEKEDQFDSCPDYFGDLEESFEDPDEAEKYRKEREGRPEALATLAKPGTSETALRATLDQSSPLDQLSRLAALLGINPRLCLCDFAHVGHWVSADDLELTWLGPGPAPEPSPQLAEIQRRQREAEIARQQDPELQLNHALLAGDEGEARRLLDAGADPNALPKSAPMLPLSAAVRGGVGCVRLLLERGADVNARGPKGGTALHLAVISGKGSGEIVRILIEAGADVNAADQDGQTALLCAVQRGLIDSRRALDVVGQLLAAGADPNLRSSAGQTPAGFIANFCSSSEEAFGGFGGRQGSRMKEMLEGVRELEKLLRSKG